MADAISIQELIDARTDAKTLEEVVNGNDAKQVTTRLGESYPSVKKAIKTLFENGGLPATPFATKALMTASSLVDGKYAMVTDDKVNNGLYVKTAGVWVKSAYDPVKLANMYTEIMFDDFLQGEKTEAAAISIIDGRYINLTNPEVTITIGYTLGVRQSLKINVLNTKQIRVENSTGHTNWFWLFADASDKYISMTSSTNPNGTFEVPKNAVTAYRNYKLADLGQNESSDFKVTKIMRQTITSTVKQVITDEKMLYASEADNINIKPISGYFAQELPTKTEYVIPHGEADVFKYIRFEVSKYKSMTVSGSSDLRKRAWVFENTDGSKSVIPAPSSNNGTFIIPSGAAYAYRTVYEQRGGGYIYDDTGLSITCNIKKEPLGDAVNTIKDEMKRLAQLIDEDDLKYMQDPNARIKPNDFEGATQTARVKKAVEFAKFRGFGVIELGYDEIEQTNVWAFTEAILLPSNCWIYVNNVTVKKANGMFDNLFRNEGLVPNPDPYGFALEINRNENIRIIGNDKTKSIIEGNLDNPKIAPSHTSAEPVPWISDYYGWRGVSVLFANTHNYRVYNLTIRKSTMWSFLNEQGCSNFTYHDINFANYGRNADGIDIHMGCHDFELYNISGMVTDDLIGLKSKLNYILSYPSGVYMYPKLAGGYADRGFGTATYNGKIWNVHTSGSFTAALLLYSGGGKIHDISFSNISDSNTNPFRHYAIRIGNYENRYGGAPTMGDCYNIALHNIRSYKDGAIVELVSPLKDSWFVNIKRMTANTDPIISEILNYAGENIKTSKIENTPV